MECRLIKLSLIDSIRNVTEIPLSSHYDKKFSRNQRNLSVPDNTKDKHIILSYKQLSRDNGEH